LHDTAKKSEGRATVVTEAQSAASKKTGDEKTDAPEAKEDVGKGAMKDEKGDDSAESKTEDVEGRTPTVKRLVIASEVKQREPVEIDEAKIEDPVFAFVELAYDGENEAGVVVTFEHDSGKKVGFVELAIPGPSPRYRTWARTRNISEPGTWTAVVKSRDGEELARKSFTVAG
jgi:hypothetical protein